MDYINNPSKYIINISGAYKKDNVEYLIENNKMIYIEDNSIVSETLKVSNVNDKYIYYNNNSFIFDIVNKRFCNDFINNDSCYSKVDKSDLTLIKTNYYDDNLNDINQIYDYNGAYRNEDSLTVSEMYVEGNEFHRVDYVEKDNPNVHQYTSKYNLLDRTDNELYFYKNNKKYSDIIYHIDTNTFTIYDEHGGSMDFRRINKGELQYLKIK